MDKSVDICICLFQMVRCAGLTVVGCDANVSDYGARVGLSLKPEGRGEKYRLRPSKIIDLYKGRFQALMSQSVGPDGIFPAHRNVFFPACFSVPFHNIV